MKKILLIAFIGAMTFVSCNKDEDTTPAADCFTCVTELDGQTITTETCKKDDTTYTVSVNGTSLGDQELPEGTTWEDYKASMTETDDCN